VTKWRRQGGWGNVRLATGRSFCKVPLMGGGVTSNGLDNAEAI